MYIESPSPLILYANIPAPKLVISKKKFRQNLRKPKLKVNMFHRVWMRVHKTINKLEESVFLSSQVHFE